METLTLNIILLILVAWSIFSVLLFIKNRFKIRDELGGFPLDELTVIIPFRNEAENLPKLLKSILSQKVHPKKYIFIDDHSTDKSAKIIQKALDTKSVHYEVKLLANELSGKKHALMEAAKMACSTYVQTLDADVWFDTKFFAKLPTPTAKQMMILPVRMVGNKASTKLMALEYGSFQILQAFASREKPIMASGANLIVERLTYISTNDLLKHAHRSSGDDQYALVQFLAQGKKVHTYFDPKLAVFTATPKNLNELLNQRARWMGNNTQGNDWRALAISIFIFAVNLSFFSLIIYPLFFGFDLIILSGIAAKFVADFIIYFNWFKRNKTWSLAPYLPILTLLYPIYLILLLWRYLQKKQIWKMRDV